MAGERLIDEHLARPPVEHLGCLLAEVVQIDAGDPADDGMDKQTLEVGRVLSVCQVDLGKGRHHQERVTVGRGVRGDAGDRLFVVDRDPRRRPLVRHQLLHHEGVASGETAGLVGHQVGNGPSHPIAPGQPRQQPLVAGDREQLLGCLRHPGLKVGDTHARAIAVLHRTTLLSPPKRKRPRATRCGSSAVVGPSWRHLSRRRGGGEDPWLCAPGFGRVYLSRCGVASRLSNTAPAAARQGARLASRPSRT